jgi:hypothetical protein
MSIRVSAVIVRKTSVAVGIQIVDRPFRYVIKAGEIISHLEAHEHKQLIHVVPEQAYEKSSAFCFVSCGWHSRTEIFFFHFFITNAICLNRLDSSKW